MKKGRKKRRLRKKRRKKRGKGRKKRRGKGRKKRRGKGKKKRRGKGKKKKSKRKKKKSKRKRKKSNGKKKKKSKEKKKKKSDGKKKKKSKGKKKKKSDGKDGIDMSNLKLPDISGFFNGLNGGNGDKMQRTGNCKINSPNQVASSLEPEQEKMETGPADEQDPEEQDPADEQEPEEQDPFNQQETEEMDSFLQEKFIDFGGIVKSVAGSLGGGNPLGGIVKSVVGGLGGGKSEGSSNPTSPAEQQTENESTDEPSEENSEQDNDEDTEENNGGNPFGGIVNSVVGGLKGGNPLGGIVKSVVGGLGGGKSEGSSNPTSASEENSEQVNDEDTEENNGGKDYLTEASAPGGSQMTMQQCHEACQMCDMCTCTFDDVILDGAHDPAGGQGHDPAGGQGHDPAGGQGHDHAGGPTSSTVPPSRSTGHVPSTTMGRRNPDGSYTSASGRTFPAGYQADVNEKYDQLRTGGELKEAERFGQNEYEVIGECTKKQYTMFLDLGRGPRCPSNECHNGGKGKCCHDTESDAKKECKEPRIWDDKHKCQSKPSYRKIAVCECRGEHAKIGNRDSCGKWENGDCKCPEGKLWPKIENAADYGCQGRETALKLHFCKEEYSGPNESRPKGKLIKFPKLSCQYTCPKYKKLDDNNRCQSTIGQPEGCLYGFRSGRCVSKGEKPMLEACEKDGRGTYVGKKDEVCKCKHPWVWPDVEKAKFYGCQSKEVAKTMKSCEKKNMKWSICMELGRYQGHGVSGLIALRETWPKFFKAGEKAFASTASGLANNFKKLVQYVLAKLLDISCKYHKRVCNNGGKIKNAISKAFQSTQKVARQASPIIKKLVSIVDKILHKLHHAFKLRLPEKWLVRIGEAISKQAGKNDYLSGVLKNLNLGKLSKVFLYGSGVTAFMTGFSSPGSVDPRFNEVAYTSGDKKMSALLRSQAGMIKILHMVDDFMIGVGCGHLGPICSIGAVWVYQETGLDGVVNDKLADVFFENFGNLKRDWSKFYKWRHRQWEIEMEIQRLKRKENQGEKFVSGRVRYN